MPDRERFQDRHDRQHRIRAVVSSAEGSHGPGACCSGCLPIAEAIAEGLEGEGVILLSHPPNSAPVTASVRFPDLDNLIVHLRYPMWTDRDARRQMFEVRHHVAMKLAGGLFREVGRLPDA